MYTVTVRDHFMIAHSFTGEVFGPAQALHGATYVVDVEFRRPDLDPSGIVVDIGRAIDCLKETLAGMNYRNLDEHPDFTGRNTTTEVLAKAIFDRIAAAAAAGKLGARRDALTGMKVTLNESHVAAASYEGDVAGRLMSELHFVLPGDPATVTGGYIYDAKALSALEARGWTVRRHVLSDRFPSPTPADRADAAALFRSLPDGATVMVDGLAYGALAAEATAAGDRLRLVGLVHHLLGDETGLSPDRRAALLQSERTALAAARHVVTTSCTTAAAVQVLGIAPDRLSVVLPGVTTGPLAVA